MLQRRSHAAVLVFAMLVSLALKASPAQAQATIVWDGSNTAAWTTGANWTPTHAAGDWLTTDIAQFGNGDGIGTQTAVNVGLQFFTGNVLSLGAIELASSRTLPMTLGNQSGAPVAGTMLLNGTTVGGDANVVLKNSSSQLLTLQPMNPTNTTQPMAVGLGNATANNVVINGTGGITISSVVTGAGRSLTVGGTGTGALKLSGANTFDGGVIINSGTVYASNANSADSATGSGAVTLNGGTLGGVGFVAGAVNVAATASLAPGESVGSLVMKNDVDLLGTLSIEYDDGGPGMDIAVVQGDLDISAGTSTLTFTDISNGGTGGAGLSPGIYVFATYGSLTGSQFNSVIDQPLNSAIDYAYFDGSSTNNIALIVSAVPEASSILFGGLACCAAGVVAGVRRVRRKRG